MKAAILLSLAALASCVTPQDLADVQMQVSAVRLSFDGLRESVDGLRSVTDDAEATDDELADAVERIDRAVLEVHGSLERANEEIGKVAERAGERTENFLESLDNAEAGGLLGIVTLLAGFGTNAHRNRQRRKRGEPVEPPWSGPGDTVPRG